MLRGRQSECARLDALLEAVRAGRSSALVVRGEPGVGKTALLEHAIESAADMKVARALGVESEMELAFAGLHQLCAPMLDRLDRIPAPQREALATAFGLTTGAVPDRFLVGLAVLSLLADVAAERPVLCVIDDAQWLDRASGQVLVFVARRLLAESVAMLFATRRPNEELEALPALVVEGLSDADARELLRPVVRGPLDERVLDRIVAETRGNPLALLELPRGLSTHRLAGGFGLPGALELSSRIEQSFVVRLDELPPPARLLVLVAAAEPLGDPALAWRAAERLGLTVDDAVPATAAGLVEFGARVRFRHPLVRSAVYRAASPEDRRRVHAALADATEPAVDPDRRAWHRAQAVASRDEDVAAALERSADRAQARGGLAAAAAFLERALLLTTDPARRGERALAAAQVKYRAGALDSALELLAVARTEPLSKLHSAQAQLLRAQISAESDRGADAPLLLLEAGKRLEPLDVDLAWDTYRDAFAAASTAGSLARAGMLDVASAVRTARMPEPPRPQHLLLEGLAVLLTDGYAAGAPIMQQALEALSEHAVSGGDDFRWLPFACRMAHDVWDDRTWSVLYRRLVDQARRTGALMVLATGLLIGEPFELFAGNTALAAAMAEEAETIGALTGSRLGPLGSIVVAAWKGREAEATQMLRTYDDEMLARGEGQWLTVGGWTSAVLYNGLGRYDDARAAAERGSRSPDELGLSSWSMVELAEAAARSGAPERASAALRRLGEIARACRTDWALGIDARSRALLSDGDAADILYREAIERLERTRVRAYLARTHLVYGEWLRRGRRRHEARKQLRTAHQMLTSMGLEAFAARAEHELLATGERVSARPAETRDELTAQEAQIARLAGDGLSNAEIGARLFISPRTVEYHLHKVFGKLGISSRNELGRALPSDDQDERTV